VASRTSFRVQATKAIKRPSNGCHSIEYRGWRWLNYLSTIADTVGFVVSFNYDLIGEHLLSNCGIPLFHCGLEEDRPDGVPIGKPHGSVDYRLADGTVVMQTGYPLNNVLSLVNTPMQRLTDDELLEPRIHVEVVPPLQASAIRHFQWVEPTFEALKRYGHIFQRCIFIGLSCWPVDQPEICEILASLAPSTEVIVANPDATAVIRFDFHARRLGLRPVIHWRTTPH
jgi:hypothetical protein